jgi:hypothetical protein
MNSGIIQPIPKSQLISWKNRATAKLEDNCVVPSPLTSLMSVVVLKNQGAVKKNPNCLSHF